MSDIPEDVMARAVELCWLKSPSPLRDQVADHLARAILQERERCAAAAREHIFDDHALAQATDFGRGCHHTATAIASAIRSARP